REIAFTCNGNSDVHCVAILNSSAETRRRVHLGIEYAETSESKEGQEEGRAARIRRYCGRNHCRHACAGDVDRPIRRPKQIFCRKAEGGLEEGRAGIQEACPPGDRKVESPRR